MIKQKLQKQIAEILGLSESEINLEHPEVFAHGDFSTNIALAKARELNKNPHELADEFAKKLNIAKLSDISEIEFAGPGFINFHLTRDFFTESIKEISEDKDFGKNDSWKGKKIMVEYTDPNPFKEFHIGHLMTNTIGESIARLFQSSQAEVKKVCYQGDVGLHVAEAVWGMQKKNIENFNIKDLAESYALGNKKYQENESAKSEIEDINKSIYKKDNEKINSLYQKGRSLSLQYFESIYQKLGTKFDHYFFESETGIFGKKMVEESLGKGVFEKSEGAVIYKGEKHGLHTRVFINKFDLPTYEAKDLGLAKLKYDTFPYDLSISVTGNEISEYFRVVKSALSNLEPELAEKLKHLPHGMLKLPSGKMSSRTGDVITAVSLIDDIKKLVLEKMEGREIENKDEVAEKIAIGSIKFSILKQSPGKDVVFDFDKSISFEGDSGPYLQYTAVRANSVLEKKSSAGRLLKKIFTFSYKMNVPKEINDVERLLFRFPEIIKRATAEYSPQFLVTYLLEVAGAFNTFYAGNKIIGSEYENYYLTLTKAVKGVLENGLNILAIKVPEKM